jgi:hypothetical protein
MVQLVALAFLGCRALIALALVYCFHPCLYIYMVPLWAKHTGLKQGFIGNTLGEHIENLRNKLETRWEHRRNMLGTKEK